MLAADTLLMFCLSTAVFLLIPGPAVLYIVARSLAQGRAAGLVATLGIHVGTLFHLLASILGLSALLVSSALAFSVVKYLGAAYLIYLGVRTLMGGGPVQPPATGTAKALPRIFGESLVVSVLNPKTAVFFLAFLPQFVDTTAEVITAQMLLLGGLFVALGLLATRAR